MVLSWFCRTETMLKQLTALKNHAWTFQTFLDDVIICNSYVYAVQSKSDVFLSIQGKVILNAVSSKNNYIGPSKAANV